MKKRLVLLVLLASLVCSLSGSAYRLANTEWTPEMESQYGPTDIPWYYEGEQEITVPQQFNTESDSEHSIPVNSIRFTGSSNYRYPDYSPYRGEFFLNRQRAKNFLHNDYVRPDRLVKNMKSYKVGNKWVLEPMGLGATRNFMYPGAVTCLVEYGINRFKWTFEGKTALDDAKKKFGNAYFNCFN